MGFRNLPPTQESTNKLLFVGSGLSTSLGLPSWTALLRDIAESALTPSDLESSPVSLDSISGNEYIFTDYLTSRINKARVADGIIRILNARQDAVPLSLIHEFAIAFESMGAKWIVTTNWDTMLERITGFPGVCLQSSDIQSSASQISRMLRSQQPFVLHLHGSIVDPPPAFTLSDIKTIDKSLREFGIYFPALFAIYEVVVLGYSFPDPYIEEILNFATTIAGGDILNIVSRSASAGKLQVNHPGVFNHALLHEYRTHEDFKDSLYDVARLLSQDRALSLILSARDSAQFIDIIERHPYNYSTTAALRELLLIRPDSSRILKWSSDYICDTEGIADPKAASICAVLLASGAPSWQPGAVEITSLRSIADAAMGEGNVDLVGLAGPLAVAVGKQGADDTMKRFIHLSAEDLEWRIHDFRTNHRYYGSGEAFVAAAVRHRNDPSRSGYLIANDIIRMLDLIRVSGEEEVHRTLGVLITDSIRMVERRGDRALSDLVFQEYEQVTRQARPGMLTSRVR